MGSKVQNREMNSNVMYGRFFPLDPKDHDEKIQKNKEKPMPPMTCCISSFSHWEKKKRRCGIGSRKVITSKA